MSGEVLVQVEGVSKKFCRSFKRSLWYGVQDMANEVLGRRAGHDRLRPDEFWAVDDVSFDLRRGECLGLIGHNGAGKTTLLKMLNGLIKLDHGKITMRGRVGALIALGAGFNPILTGRENIYVNGSILGLNKKAVERKMDEIIDFAELGDFIDMPVQSYSSGMAVRLGFSIATTLEPDVLLLDEVLAVGDAAFRARCYNRIGARQQQAAVIFVSHNSDQIARICDRVCLLHKGRITHLGDVGRGLELYGKLTKDMQTAQDAFLHCEHPIDEASIAFATDSICWGEPLCFSLQIVSRTFIAAPSIHGVIYDTSGATVSSFVWKSPAGGGWDAQAHTISIRLPCLTLRQGDYYLGLAINSETSLSHLVWSYKQHRFSIEHAPPGLAASVLPVEVTCA
jgi:lipopolysaccharide transport system ATP-binding protein